jgi:ABC-type branched-subunit amino acid transport system substrate-binding protein
MEQNKKLSYILVLGIIVVLAIVFVSYGTQTTKEQIRVGVIAPFSGIMADYGEQLKKGILAVPHDGIEYIFEDDKCDNAPAIGAFKKLTELDGVHFILGPGCGAPQEAIAPLLRGMEVVVLVPSAASVKLHEESGGNLYNIQYALEDEAKFLAEQMYARGHKDVALISYQNAFSKVHHDNFIKNFKGTIVRDIIFLKDDTEVVTEIAKLKGVKFDAIFSTDVTFLFAKGPEKLKQFGFNQPIFSQYAVEIPAVKPMAEGITYSFPSGSEDPNGIVASLSRQSAEFFVPLIKECQGDYSCVKQRMDSSGVFDERGIRSRGMIMKKMINGVPTIL